MMHGVVFRGDRVVAYEQLPKPVIETPLDVIVKVKYAGLCGSDIHPYLGREAGLAHGTVMGHEFVGTVYQVGEDVKSLVPGDLVCSPFTTNCGHCFQCQNELTARCEQSQLFGWIQDGVGLHGGQAEFVRVPGPLAESTLLKVPEGVSPECSLLAGDIFSTGFWCAQRAGACDNPDGVYAVVGCGPVGLMAVSALRAMGVKTVIAIDSIPDRLDFAKRFGAVTVNFSTQNAVEIINAHTSNRGCDGVLEVVGYGSALKLAYDVVRPGGIISSIGVHTDPTMPFSAGHLYDKNLTLRAGRCPARAMMPRSFDLIKKCAAMSLDVASVFTHRVPLSTAARAYEMFHLKEDKCIKVLLVPESKE